MACCTGSWRTPRLPSPAPPQGIQWAQLSGPTSLLDHIRRRQLNVVAGRQSGQLPILDRGPRPEHQVSIGTERSTHQVSAACAEENIRGAKIAATQSLAL